LSYAADQRHGAKQHLSLPPRKNQHLSSAREVGQPFILPRAGRRKGKRGSGQSFLRGRDCRGSWEQPRMQEKNPLTWRQKSQPASTFSLLFLAQDCCFLPTSQKTLFHTALQRSLLCCTQYQDTGQRYNPNSPTGKRPWNKTSQVCKRQTARLDRRARLGNSRARAPNAPEAQPRQSNSGVYVVRGL